MRSISWRVLDAQSTSRTPAEGVKIKANMHIKISFRLKRHSLDTKVSESEVKQKFVPSYSYVGVFAISEVKPSQVLKCVGTVSLFQSHQLSLVRT